MIYRVLGSEGVPKATSCIRGMLNPTAPGDVSQQVRGTAICRLSKSRPREALGRGHWGHLRTLSFDLRDFGYWESGRPKTRVLKLEFPGPRSQPDRREVEALAPNNRQRQAVQFPRSGSFGT